MAIFAPIGIAWNPWAQVSSRARFSRSILAEWAVDAASVVLAERRLIFAKKDVGLEMQSSAAVTFRAAVMLVCLVLVPLAAVFGSSFPQVSQVVKSLLRGNGIPRFAGATSETPDPRRDAGEAPAFAAGVQLPEASADGVDPRMLPAASPSGGSAAPAPFGGIMSGSAHSTPPAAMPSASQAAPGPAVHPATFPSPVNSAAAPLVAPSTACATFQQIERRLRELGATYYLLETWGPNGEQYRFHCKMAIAGNPNYNRHFEATESDPIRAMRAALDQVEQWRSGSQQ